MKGERRSGNLIPKGDKHQCRTKKDRERDEEQYHILHLGHSDRTCLQSVCRPSVLIRIRPLEGIAQFIAEVTEDLQGQSGTYRQSENKPKTQTRPFLKGKRVISKARTQNDAGDGER